MSAAHPRRYRRSPLLLVRWSGDEAMLLQADTLSEFRFHKDLLSLVTALRDWSTAEELAARGSAVSEADLAALCEAGILEADDDTVSPASRLWEPLELAVHRRTAQAGAPADAGGSPPPGRPLGPAFALPEPGALDGELAAVLRERRTVRTYAPRPLRLTELSTLLHHAAGSQEGSDPPRRPFAAAGARSELELYVVANDVEGLEPGAWHYRSPGHEVARMGASESHLAELSRWVNAATGDALSRDPPAILLITAQYERMASKYGHLALSLVYKDVGCLFENLYLVATALGLAPCAIGGADERANSRWLGLDPLAEPQVGCFLIGPR